MGSLNLEGSGRPLPRRTPTQRQRDYARLDSRFLADTHGTRRSRTRRPPDASPRRQKMKAAVFAALATTAAAFAPVARPLAAAAATKLSVVPETVAELPSMLTALPTLTAPQEGELFFTSPFFVAFFVLSSAFGWPVLAALRLNSLEE